MRISTLGAVGLMLAGGSAFAQQPTPLGNQIQVNTYTSSYQRNAAVALDALGRFVVVWESDGSSGSDTSSYSVQGQRYDSSGTPIGGEFQVNSFTTSYQGEPAVDFNAEGEFIVVWDSFGSYGNDGSNRSIQGQWYDDSGTPIGEQFQVNSYTTNIQRRPATVVLDNHGNFVAVWDSVGSFGNDNREESVQAQRFLGVLFADGFESGDTSAWSSSVP